MNAIFNDFIGIVIALSILLVIILYLLSKLLKQQNLQNLFIDEFSELVVNIGILLSMGAIVMISNAVMNEVIVSLGFAPSTNVYDWLQLQLNTLQNNVGKEMAFLMMVGQAAKVYSNAQYLTGYPGAKTVKGSLYPGVDLFINSIFTVNGLLLIVMGSLTVQQLLLDIFKYLAFGFFLPVGVLLRFIPGVRAFGSEMIAISIAFGLVFPMMYFLMYSAMYDIASIRGGYYLKFAEKNSQYLDTYLLPAKVVDEQKANAENTANNLYSAFEGFSLPDEYKSSFGDWLKSIFLTYAYAAYYVLNIPISSILLFYRFIDVGGYITYAVAIPAFAITFAMVSTKAIKDFIHNL